MSLLSSLDFIGRKKYLSSFDINHIQRKTMNNPSSTDEQNRLPKDGLVVQTMLQEMGITNYEPKLIPMVLDFMHRS
jgi:hypothetical protein